MISRINKLQCTFILHVFEMLFTMHSIFFYLSWHILSTYLETTVSITHLLVSFQILFSQALHKGFHTCSA